VTGGIVRTAGEVDRKLLDHFLGRVYRPEKAAFLRRHGDWWYRGQENSWVLEDGGAVVAYCAVMPVPILIGREPVNAVWWIDLVVDPDHRGRGLQRIFDEKVRAAAPLIVGFPNAVAAKIHRGHGWGVREDLRVLLMPLCPREVGAAGRLKGWKGRAVRVAAAIMSPAASMVRQRLRGFVPRFARQIGEPDPATLADVFKRQTEMNITTTLRDESYLRWRFLEAPYRDDLRFFCAGRTQRVDVVAITRSVEKNRRTVVRVLDLFGNLADSGLVREVVWLAARDAVKTEAAQVTVMATDERLRAVLRRTGFIASAVCRFCWWSNDDALMNHLSESRTLWSLADSDNDEL
jgi:GNAT superfamily N-acetyltransferase